MVLVDREQSVLATVQPLSVKRGRVFLAKAKRASRDEAGWDRRRHRGSLTGAEEPPGHLGTGVGAHCRIRVGQGWDSGEVGFSRIPRCIGGWMAALGPHPPQASTTSPGHRVGFGAILVSQGTESGIPVLALCFLDV